MEAELYGYRRLKLSVIKKSNFRSESGVLLEDDPYWKKLRLDILRRDRNACYYCGFTYPSYMEVHHLNGNWANNKSENLITVCPLCHSCLHIGLASLQDRGRLLVLNTPAIQSALNRLILDVVSKYAPDKDKISRAAEQIKASLDIREDLGESGLQDLSNIMAAAAETGTETPQEIRDTYVFFPNIFNFRITSAIIDSAQKKKAIAEEHA